MKWSVRCLFLGVIIKLCVGGVIVIVVIVVYCVFALALFVSTLMGSSNLRLIAIDVPWKIVPNQKRKSVCAAF